MQEILEALKVFIEKNTQITGYIETQYTPKSYYDNFGSSVRIIPRAFDFKGLGEVEEGNGVKQYVVSHKILLQYVDVGSGYEYLERLENNSFKLNKLFYRPQTISYGANAYFTFKAEKYNEPDMEEVEDGNNYRYVETWVGEIIYPYLENEG